MNAVILFSLIKCKNREILRRLKKLSWLSLSLAHPRTRLCTSTHSNMNNGVISICADTDILFPHSQEPLRHDCVVKAPRGPLWNFCCVNESMTLTCCCQCGSVLMPLWLFVSVLVWCRRPFVLP